VTQAGEQASNITRTAWLSQALPYQTAATTVDCQCGSAQQANNFVANLVGADAIDIGIACGVEAMSRVKLGANVFNGPGNLNPEDFPWDMPDQFGAGERIAQKYGITREDVDWLGFESQRKAAVAVAEGRFDREIVPLETPVVGPDGPTGEKNLIAQDQGPRDTTREGLAGASRWHAHRRQLFADLRRCRRRVVGLSDPGGRSRPTTPGPHRGPDVNRLRSLLPPGRSDLRHHRRVAQGGYDHGRH
jgi:acetyl-CoA acetyltransferase